MDKDAIELIRAEAARGVQQVAVLAALADAQHGYQLMEVLKEYGIDIESGSLYPMLRRLESRGLLRSEWDTSGPRPRRIYVTTDAGRDALEVVKPVWDSFMVLLEKVLGSPER